MEKFNLGLDIGIASVGWCLLGESRIIDLGVRCFDKAETAKEGESLNKVRRDARLMRHRLYRRAWRLTQLARLLKRHGLIEHVDRIRKPPTKSSPMINAWSLRVEALDRRLTHEEWARVIYHLCKHRGFHWISRAEKKKVVDDKVGEGRAVKKGLADTKRRMAEKSYRTAAEMVLAEFPDAQRNKAGDYGKALSRVLLADELRLLFEKQRQLGNPHADEALQAAVLGDGDRKSGLFWKQKPALSGQDLLKMLGHCTFEKAEYRAPKASFTAERHVWLTRLNNLRIVVDGTTRPLNDAERQCALPLPYQQASDFTYKQLHTALVKKGLLPESFAFAGLRGSKGKDPLAERLVKHPAWQALRGTFRKAGLETEWGGIAGSAMSGKPDTLDDIARVLSVFKDGDEAERELRALALPGGEAAVQALLDLSFSDFHALSLKALRQIVPLMESGLRYDEAVAAIPEYGHHSRLKAPEDDKLRYLPEFYERHRGTGKERNRMLFSQKIGEDIPGGIPRNPVVMRALNQARKVVNAIIRKYGSPQNVHIEMARDLSRPLDERRSIEKEQKEYRERNDEDWKRFVSSAKQLGLREVPVREKHGHDFAKWQLYHQQLCKCAYSIQPIELERLLEPGYVEIDHALPYSRSFDDSKNNKVLVLAKENRDKGNRTPYEYLDGEHNSPRWQSFVAYIDGNKNYRLAKRSRLLRKDFGKKEAEEFRERNLNDTRYICRFFKNYVERYLQLAEDSEAKRCVVLSGQTTAFLRARWGLLKVRSDSDRHHALDAAVVAACSHGMVKRLADYSRRKELEKVRDGFVDLETGEIINPAMHQQLHEHFPEPWLNFRHELEARLKIDDPAVLRAEMERFGTYSAAALDALRPLFVSRAPQRRNGGAAHKDTIYAQPERLKTQGGVTQKVPLASLTLKDLDNLIDPHRNKKLYAAIRTRLEQHGGNGDKAFPANDPLRKPDRDGNPTGPIVRSVTMVIDKLSGIPIRGGIAKNDTMLRVDVFTKAGKFHLVPVYVHHMASGKLPDRAIVAFKDEDEWTLIDDSFAWCFSLYPNDYVEVRLKNNVFRGYYAGCDRSTGAVGLWFHDRNQQVGKDGLIRGIGVKTASSVEKFHIDVLGNIYAAPPEPRRGLA